MGSEATNWARAPKSDASCQNQGMVTTNPKREPLPRHRLSTPRARLTTPLMRIDDELRPVSWDDALDRVAGGFAALKAEHGPSAFALFSCSKSTNEMNYAAQKFARLALGTNNIDSCNRT
jgi:formate dehydrogenase (hydrogenase)